VTPFERIRRGDGHVSLSGVRRSSFLKISDLALAPRIVNEGNVNLS
jgi:hypothetical protein